jgi:hypothetical protein
MTMLIVMFFTQSDLRNGFLKVQHKAKDILYIEMLELQAVLQNRAIILIGLSGIRSL